METKLNIAEILKDKPKGTRLYSPIFGECVFGFIQNTTNDVCVKKYNGEKEFFDSKGLYNALGEVMMFPSKEMRDWSKFAWKKGDVLISNDSKKEVFFNGFTDNTYVLFKAKHGFEVHPDGSTMYLGDEDYVATDDYVLEDKDAAKIYINTIEERLNGKLNRETLEIEPAQQEFKDGDIAFADFGITQDVFIVTDKTNLSEGYYSYVVLNLNTTKTLSIGCKTSFFKENLCTLRFATDSEKQQLFDALAKKGKTWDAEKKAIVDLKPKCEFKPFDKVLSRRCSEDYWVLNFYSHKTDYYHICIDGSSNLDCIPYNEETAHLLGTTDEWKGGEG